MTRAPTFSVILACKDPGPRLRTAVASVWGQRDAAWELIVIDGGSTDGTRAWLDSARAELAALVTEPDRGVYDAMNKGLGRARGEWVYFLGADDRLEHAAVLAEAAALLAATPADICGGEARYEDGRIYRFDPAASRVARNFVHHQAAFYRRELFMRHGGFDLTYAIAADYELNLRFATRGARFAAVPLRVAECGIGGLSDGGDWRVYREEIAVRHRFFPAPRCWPWDVASAMRFLRKQLVRRRRAAAPHG